MTIKAHQFDHVVQKLQLRTRQADHLVVWFEYEGQVLAKTRRSNRPGDLPFQKSIPKQLKLSREEFRRAVSCKLARDEYIEILKRKGIIK